MPRKSLAYAKMRKALLDEVARIPPMHVVEFAAMGEALNIPARHVAHILSALTKDERLHLPWHRVVPRGGDFGPPGRRTVSRQQQIDQLRSEGHDVVNDRYLDLNTLTAWCPSEEFKDVFWADLGDDD